MDKEKKLKILTIIEKYIEAISANNGAKIFSLANGLRILLYEDGNLTLEKSLIDLIPPENIGKFERDLRKAVFIQTHSKEANPGLLKIISELKQILENENNSSNYKLFYSWQSDLPNSTNRGFIENVLEKIVKTIKSEDGIELKIDQDTRGIPGSPDIINSILNKINKCGIFLADITPIIMLDENHIPNPNVMFELGYAFNSLTDSKIIMLFNNAYGDIKYLPFDLGLKRQVVYNCSEKDTDKGLKRKILEDKLLIAIRSIILKTQ